ncbi:UDP-glycosyltransferase 73C11-like [Phragmites australis]|uniref:UDP-glycosyltransferase 73C11-like n=1 Tax=Phragmites australis TaxID=29695 RepID=UPI002D770B35|nr:UDP-glycosyltransferase 73C11-like [Phragmites australis]
MNFLDDAPKPHFVLVPFMAQGHTIPMIDMAHLLAKHGAIVSFITTPANASRIESTIDRARALNLPIQFVPLKLRCAEVGLPEGCENVDKVLEKEQVKRLTDAYSMLHKPLVSYLRAQSNNTPSCIISDLCQPWTGDVARELGIPRLMFNGFCAFASLCRNIIHHEKVFENVADDNELIVLPGFPHRLEVSKARSPGNFNSPGFEEFSEKILEEERRADGVVTNSFYELEPLYHEEYQKKIGTKVWSLGPMFLCNTDMSAMAARGDRASVDAKHCLQWLDSMKPGSVLYVSFGSMTRTVLSQLEEIALGLEASKMPFLWVIKSDDKPSDIEKLLAEGFEERTRDRGLIIRGWAPQAMILSHPSLGGFMTHCGWNSTIEGISNGVPMITWPHCAEQFLNEKLIVDVLKVGVAVGVQSITARTVEVHEVSVVKRYQIERTVLKLMGEDMDAEERRLRAMELKGKARQAIDGGSSYSNVKHLIEYVLTKKIRPEVQ